MTLPGIDISKWQATTPDLTGLSFCFVKASEGLASDSMYPTHAANVKASGIVLGAYHFSRSDISTPELQAQHFVAAAPGAELYALDVEGTNVFSPAQIAAFMAEMHRLGKTCGLYASRSPFGAYLGCGQDFNWVAQWTSSAPNIPWTFWQYGSRKIGAMSVDGDTFNGDLNALNVLAGRDDVNLDRITYQSWTANGTNGVLRDQPVRSLTPSVTLPAGTPIISIGEYVSPDGNNWRAAEWPVGSHTVRYFLRTGPGIAPDHDFIAGPFVSFGASQTEIDNAMAAQKAADDAACAKTALAAKQAGYDLAVSGASVTTPKVTFPPRPVS